MNETTKDKLLTEATGHKEPAKLYIKGKQECYPTGIPTRNSKYMLVVLFQPKPTRKGNRGILLEVRKDNLTDRRRAA